MRDYTLALGDEAPYGFSAPSDGAALLHAHDYVTRRSTAHGTAFMLSGPDGLLSEPGEEAAVFCRRIGAAHIVENTDDVRPADPTPPDCNTA